MKARHLVPLAALLLAGMMAAEAASAHGRSRSHSGARVGVFIGAPAFAYGGWYGYRPYPYYYPPAYVVPAPVVMQPAPPPLYIERSDGQAGVPPSAEYWYYCPDTKAYYPHVGTCASPWQRVAPQPPQS